MTPISVRHDITECQQFQAHGLPQRACISDLTGTQLVLLLAASITHAICQCGLNTLVSCELVR